MILLSISKPAPEQNEYLIIKMRKNQKFGTIKEPLLNRFKKRITHLSLESTPITDDMTPDDLINMYDIDAVYE